MPGEAGVVLVAAAARLSWERDADTAVRFDVRVPVCSVVSRTQNFNSNV